MPRLQEQDRLRLCALQRELLFVRLDGQPGLERVMQELRRCLGARRVVARGLLGDPADERLAFSATAAAPDAGGGACEHRLELHVCEGPLLDAWVVAELPEPASRRQQQLLRALAPTLRRRLTAECLLDAAPLAEAAMAAALEVIPRPAFVVDDDGRVQHLNGAARALRSAGPERVAADLAAAVQAGGSPAIDVQSLDASFRRAAFLAVYRDDAADPRPRVARMASRWGLTRRQTEVLSRLAVGESNKAIAAHLGCALNTVELHVTEIFKKSGVDSRAALVATFWMSR